METIYLQAGRTFITTVLVTVRTIEGLCQVKGKKFLSNSLLSQEEVGVGDPSISHSILEVCYLPIVSDNFFKGHLSCP